MRLGEGNYITVDVKGECAYYHVPVSRVPIIGEKIRLKNGILYKVCDVIHTEDRDILREKYYTTVCVERS